MPNKYLTITRLLPHDTKRPENFWWYCQTHYLYIKYGTRKPSDPNAYESVSRIFPIAEEEDAAVRLDSTGEVTEPPHCPYLFPRWMSLETSAKYWFSSHLYTYLSALPQQCLLHTSVATLYRREISETDYSRPPIGFRAYCDRHPRGQIATAHTVSEGQSRVTI